MTTTASAFDSLARRKARLPEPEPEKYSQQMSRTEERGSHGDRREPGQCTSQPAPRREASWERTNSGPDRHSWETADASQIGAPRAFSRTTLSSNQRSSWRASGEERTNDAQSRRFRASERATPEPTYMHSNNGRHSNLETGIAKADDIRRPATRASFRIGHRSGKSNNARDSATYTSTFRDGMWNVGHAAARCATTPRPSSDCVGVKRHLPTLGLKRKPRDSHKRTT